MTPPAKRPGRERPLRIEPGATWDGAGVNFALSVHHSVTVVALRERQMRNVQTS